MQDAFLHSLVTGLIGMKDEFEQEDFCTAVFDEFFFTCINIDNVVRHLMRLLWWVHTKLPPARLETLLKVILSGNKRREDQLMIAQVAEPRGGGEAVVEAYEELKLKISESGGQGDAAGDGSPAPAAEEAASTHF